MFLNLCKQQNQPRTDEMILSPNIFLSLDTRKTLRNCNVLCIAESGAVKRQKYLLPNLLQANCSYVVVDYGGVLQEETEPTFREKGYDIKVLDLRQLDGLGPVEGAHYNPFHYVRSDADILSLVNALTTNFHLSSVVSDSPALKRARQALMNAMAFYFYKDCHPSDQTFSNVLELMRGNDAVNSLPWLDLMFYTLSEKDPEHIAVKHYSLFRSASGTDANAQKVIYDLAFNLTAFNISKVADFSNQDDLNLESIGLKPTAVYLTLSTTDNVITKLFLPLFFTQLFDTLYHTAATKCEKRQLPQHVRVLFDQFGEWGVIPDFTRMLATMRTYHISCDIITHNLAILKQAYAEDWDVIVGNCDSLVWMDGSRVQTDCFGGRIAKSLPKDYITRRRIMKKCPARLHKNVRLLKSSEKLKDLSKGESLVLIRGCIPFID